MEKWAFYNEPACFSRLLQTHCHFAVDTILAPHQLRFHATFGTGIVYVGLSLHVESMCGLFMYVQNIRALMYPV